MAVKVLIVAPAWVGDMVMAHCLVPPLAERGAEVHFLAPPATAPLAERMPGVAAVHGIAARRGHLDFAARRAAAARLRPLGFDQAIVLPNTFKSALTPLLARIPQRTGFLGEHRFGVLNDIRRLDAARLPRMVDRFAALGAGPPARPVLRADAAARDRLLARHGLDAERPAVALCPGAAFGPAKRWPAQRFASLARRCARAGAAVWVLGGPGDAGIGAQIAAHAPAVNLAGYTTLQDAVDLLSAARAAVANDSGLLHVAAALGVPVAAVYGSSSPDFTPPLGARVRIVERQLACRPCFDRACRFGHLDCLRGIGGQRVFGALAELGAFAERSAPAPASTDRAG